MSSGYSEPPLRSVAQVSKNTETLSQLHKFGSSHKPLFNDEGDPSGARKPSHAIGHMQEVSRLVRAIRCFRLLNLSVLEREALEFNENGGRTQCRYA